MEKTLIQNRKAYHNYEILEKYEAGIELRGFEVKSLKSGKGSLEGVYVSPRNNELYLINFDISPYQAKNVGFNYNSKRERRLLLKRKEINYLIGKLKEKGLTIVPLRVYLKNRLVKVEIALVRGLKKYEKKEKIKKREFEREKKRFLKYSNKL